MKSSILPLAFAALIFSSCTSAYKTTQTPDDVYYSPTRPQEEYVQTEKRDDQRYRNSDEYYEDRYLRMRVANRYQWSTLDDYYFNSPYAYNYSFYGGSWRSPYNSYWCWNNYYNPYYAGYHYYNTPVIIAYPTKRITTPPSRPIAFNANSYNPGSVKPISSNRAHNTYIPTTTGSNGSRYNNRNSSSSNSGTFGNSLRRIFSNSNGSNDNNSSRSSSTPSRSYNPSSSSSSSSSSSRPSSSSSSSSGGGGGSRPGR